MKGGYANKIRILLEARKHEIDTQETINSAYLPCCRKQTPKTSKSSIICIWLPFPPLTCKYRISSLQMCPPIILGVSRKQFPWVYRQMRELPVTSGPPGVCWPLPPFLPSNSVPIGYIYCLQSPAQWTDATRGECSSLCWEDSKAILLDP